MPERVMRLRATMDDVRIGLWSQPGRTGLAFLGIGVGMAALTVLLSLLGGLEQKSRRIVEDFGANVFGMTQEPDAGGGGLAERHVDYLARNLPGCVVTGARIYSVAGEGGEQGLRFVATDSEHIRVRPWRMVAGRFLDAADLRTRARYAVAGRALSEAMQWEVGDTVVLHSVPFRLVGIVALGGDAMDVAAGTGIGLGERVVFVPRSLAPYWLSQQAAPAPRLDMILVRVGDAAHFGQALADAGRLLAHPDYAAPNLSWVTPDSLIRELRGWQHLIRATVGSIALLCLILGGTTLMSLMLSNVRDRISEIGLRRSLGAGKREIGLLFLAEACVISLAAGLTGTAATLAVLWFGRAQLPVPVKLGADVMAIPVVAAIVLAAVFSYWPARAAANITPSEALRNG